MMNWKEIYAKLNGLKTDEETLELIRAACAKDITLSISKGQRILPDGREAGLALYEKFEDASKAGKGTFLTSEEAACAIAELLTGEGAYTAEELYELSGEEFVDQVQRRAYRSFEDACEGYFG